MKHMVGYGHWLVTDITVEQNSYILSELLFQESYFFKVPTFSLVSLLAGIFASRWKVRWQG